MTVWYANNSRPTRLPSDTPGWLQRLLGNVPPPDPLTEVVTRLTLLEAQQATATIERANLIESNARLEERLQTTQAELAQSREYGKQQANLIANLHSTIGSVNRASERLTTEFSGMAGANGALQEALRRLESDHKIDQETISMLRERMKAMEAEIVRLTDINAQYVGTNAGKQLAIDELNKRLGLAIERLNAAGLSTEGLL